MFLTACEVGSSDIQTEQVAEWEMCVFLELRFFWVFLFQGISTFCFPSLKVVLSALLGAVDLSHMFIKRQGRESTLPCRGVFIPAAVPEMVAVPWVATVPAVLQLAMKDKPCPEILRPHKSDSPPFDWRWLGCKI